MQVSQVCQTLAYQAGQVFIWAGEPITGYYRINKGYVKLTRPCTFCPCGRDLSLKLLGPADSIGLPPLFNNHSARFSATALSDLEVCFIPRKHFFKLLDESHEATRELLEEMVRMFTEVVMEHASGSASLPVIERLKSSLPTLQAYFGTKDGWVENILKRGEIAAMIGTTPESVIRAFSELEDGGFLSCKGKKFKIL